MAHEIHASIILKLKDEEPKEWITALSVVATQWAQFLDAVSPLQGITAFSIQEVKPPGDGQVGRQRRGRPRKVVADNADGEATGSEAEQLARLA